MKIKALSLCALFCAALTVSAQIIIPTPLGIPLTVSTLMIFLLSSVFPELCLKTVIVYVLCGALGIGVFSGFSGGLGILLSPVGGYISGYIPMAFFCSKKTDSKLRSALFCIIGISLCHILGFIFYLLYQKTAALPSFLFFTAIYVKDLIFCILAKGMGKNIKKALNSKGF